MRAFIAGFLAARGTSGGGVFGSDCGLDPESLGERLKALFTAGSHHVFLAPAEIAGPLAEALAQRGAEVGLRLERQRVVTAVSFRFRAEVFSRELAAEIRAALIGSLPEGVRVEDLSEAEERHPEARGPEPFAPFHDYIYRASGRIAGPVPGVLEVRRRSIMQDFVETGSLRLEGIPGPP